MNLRLLDLVIVVIVAFLVARCEDAHAWDRVILLDNGFEVERVIVPCETWARTAGALAAMSDDLAHEVIPRLSGMQRNVAIDALRWVVTYRMQGNENALYEAFMWCGDMRSG